MNDADWVNVDTFADRFSAAALVGLLAGEGVPAYIASDEPIPGLARSFSVLVAPPLLPPHTLEVPVEAVLRPKIMSRATPQNGFCVNST